MTTAAAHPHALSDPARTFAAAPHRLLIGGERLEAADGRTFESVDPATGRPIADFPQAGAEDVDRAVRTAREAFEDGRWSGIAAAERTRAMVAFADTIDANAEELAQLESLDNGKPVKLARRVDVPLASAHIRYFAGWPTKIEGGVLPVAQPNMHCYTRKEPVGVAGQIIPWNFPLLMAAWKVAPALAAGCTVVLKPAEQTPLTALRLGELALEAGLPEGVLNVITGDGGSRSGCFSPAAQVSAQKLRRRLVRRARCAAEIGFGRERVGHRRDRGRSLHRDRERVSRQLRRRSRDPHDLRQGCRRAHRPLGLWAPGAV